MALKITLFAEELKAGQRGSRAQCLLWQLAHALMGLSHCV